MILSEGQVWVYSAPDNDIGFREMVIGAVNEHNLRKITFPKHEDANYREFAWIEELVIGWLEDYKYVPDKSTEFLNLYDRLSI